MNGIDTVDKCALAQQFSAAATHYEEWAKAQAEIAARLMQRLPAEIAPSRMVDLGCGTGLLSAHLLKRFPAASLIGIDLAAGMVEHCRRSFGNAACAAAATFNDASSIRASSLDLAATSPGAQFVTGDVEDPGMLVRQADLIASSCVAQWFADMPATVRMWAQTLAPGGRMAFACLLQGSFGELEEAYSEALDCRFPGLPLPAPQTLPALFRACGLRMLVCEEDSVSALYGSARAALRSFQEIGAGFQGQPGHRPLGPAALRRLMASYERHADAQGMVPVTHRVQYAIAERG